MIRQLAFPIVCLALLASGLLNTLCDGAEPTVHTPRSRPRVFPAQDDFTIPLGTSQLFLPYIETPTDLPLDDYQLVVDLPSALRLVAVDSIAGVAGRVIKQTERPGRRIIAIDNPLGVGMELSMCWQDATPATISYVPALRAGGTCEWRRISATIRSPANAVSCKPLLIKWQRRGLFGTADFDDITMHEVGSTMNLLAEGSFEGPFWRDHPNRHVVQTERDGKPTRAARISGTRENTDRQDALWLGQGLAVKPDTLYVFEAIVTCDAVGSTISHPRAALLLRLDDPTFSGGVIRFGFRAHGGQVVEATQSVPVRALPPLLGKRPRESRIVPCYYGDVVAPETSAAIAENIRLSGITGLYGRAGNRVAQAVQKAGGTLTWSFPYNGWQLSPAPDWAQTHLEYLAVDFQGRRDKGRICPTYALEPGNQFVPKLEAWVHHAVAGTSCTEIDIDYEVPVTDPPGFCFCARCLDAFRTKAKLSSESTIDAKTVVTKYRKQWTDFRCCQNARLIGKLAGWIRAAKPETHISVYSGFQSVRTREHYGVDWSLLRPHIDLGVAGYGGSPAALAATVAALQEKPLMGGEMYYLSFHSAERGPLRRDGWKMRLLRCFINSGCHGVLIWWLPVLDGQGYFETSQCAAVIHDFEDFFRRGQRVDDRVRFAGNWPAEDFAAFALREKILLVLFNPTKEKRNMGPISVNNWKSISAQHYDDVRGELESNHALPSFITLPARDAQVWLLNPKHE